MEGGEAWRGRAGMVARVSLHLVDTLVSTITVCKERRKRVLHFIQYVCLGQKKLSLNRGGLEVKMHGKTTIGT